VWDRGASVDGVVLEGLGESGHLLHVQFEGKLGAVGGHVVLGDEPSEGGLVEGRFCVGGVYVDLEQGGVRGEGRGVVVT